MEIVVKRIAKKKTYTIGHLYILSDKDVKRTWRSGVKIGDKRKMCIRDSLNGDTVKTDGQKIFEAMSAHMERVKVEPQVKKPVSYTHLTLCLPLYAKRKCMAQNIFKLVLTDEAQNFIESLRCV